MRYGQYFRPNDLSVALDWLAANDARVAAGCTDLFAATGAPWLAGDVLDVTAIEGLRGISKGDAYWRFGATTTWSDVRRADLPPAFDALKLAAREVGSRQIQNAATLAGNICNASPAADGVPCFLALDAIVEVRSRQAIRHVAMHAFIAGPRQTLLERDEIVTAILVPDASTLGRSAFVKLGARKYLVISTVMVAARLTESDGVISDVAVAVGACSKVATRLVALEGALIGQRMAEQPEALITPAMVTDAIDPIDDLRSDAVGRTAAALELVRRTLASLVRLHLTPSEGAAI